MNEEQIKSKLSEIEIIKQSIKDLQEILKDWFIKNYKDEYENDKEINNSSNNNSSSDNIH
jgi:hypothetical protein